MSSLKPGLIQFNGGEISPWLEGRVDWQKYSSSGKLCRNFIPTVEGSLKRRGGTHFVSFVKGVLKSTFIFLLRTDAETDYPLLSVNGAVVELLKMTGAVWQSRPYTFFNGEVVSYEAKCSGYVTKSGIMTVKEQQEDVCFVLSKPSEADTSLEIVAFSDDVEVTINGVKRKTITVQNGDTVSWIASYEGKSKSGSVVLAEDKKLWLFLKNDEIQVSDGEILVTSAPTQGTFYFPNCKIRGIAVGGGGGAYEMALNVDIFYCGGSGAGLDAVFNLTAGLYSYACGKLGANVAPNVALSSEDGGPTYLKSANKTIFQAGGGKAGHMVNGDWWYGGAGGVYTIDNEYVRTLNWAKNGNKCPAGRKGSYLAGVSVYNGYGWGEGYRGTDDAFYYYTGTNGFLSLTFVG